MSDTRVDLKIFDLIIYTPFDVALSFVLRYIDLIAF